jgi:hypothetical protein
MPKQESVQEEAVVGAIQWILPRIVARAFVVSSCDTFLTQWSPLIYQVEQQRQSQAPVLDLACDRYLVLHF